MKLFPEAEGTFTFCDRDNTEYNEDFLERLKLELANLSMVRMTKEELDWSKNIRCAAGIGTNLTNDCGFKPSNIVMKLTNCCMNPNQPWNTCIKLSDDEGKHMGFEDEIGNCLYELGLT